jgi:hypothetical protein
MKKMKSLRSGTGRIGCGKFHQNTVNMKVHTKVFFHLKPRQSCESKDGVEKEANRGNKESCKRPHTYPTPSLLGDYQNMSKI